MYSDSLLRGLSIAAYGSTIAIFGFLYAGILTPWSFAFLFVFIWIVLGGVVLQRASKAAEREMAQKIFKMLGEKSAKKDIKDLLSKMNANVPHGGEPVN